MESSDSTVSTLLYHKVLPHKYAHKMHDSLGNVASGKGYSTKSRYKRVFTLFMEFCSEHDIFIEQPGDLALAYSLVQEYLLGKTEKRAETIKSDVRALWVVLTRLMRDSITGLPYVKLPRPLRFKSDVFTSSKAATDKVLGGLQIPNVREHNSSNEEDVSLTLALETDTDTFIANLIDSMRKHRDVIRKVSSAYLTEAEERLSFAQSAIDAIPSSKFDSPGLLHPTQRAEGTGQHLSLFSSSLSEGECGLSNLIAFLYHKRRGLIRKDFVGASNHLSRFTNQYQIREYFGLSTLSAVAAQNIIILDSGINVDSLRNLKVSATGSAANVFEPTSTGGFTIQYYKARAKAKAHKKRRLKYDADKQAVNIETAFSYLVDATELHRAKLQGEDARVLFIHDSVQERGLPRPISSIAFKAGIRRLLIEAKKRLKTDPNWCEGVTLECIDEVLKHSPTAKKLRVTEGIIRWFDAGGNPAVAAKYLGNTESVAINNYLPKELQLAVYSQKVRRFQHVLIASATDGEEYQLDALDLKDEKELAEYIRKLDARVPNWRTLHTLPSDLKDLLPKKKAKVHITICRENVALLYSCYQILLKKQEVNEPVDDLIREVADTYQALMIYSKQKGDRRLDRTIAAGISLYESRTNDYENLDFIKEKVIS